MKPCFVLCTASTLASSDHSNSNHFNWLFWFSSSSSSLVLGDFHCTGQLKKLPSGCLLLLLCPKHHVPLCSRNLRLGTAIRPGGPGACLGQQAHTRQGSMEGCWFVISCIQCGHGGSVRVIVGFKGSGAKGGFGGGRGFRVSFWV